MAILITLTLLSIAGIGIVFWLLKTEQETEGASLRADETEGLRLMKDFGGEPPQEPSGPPAAEGPRPSFGLFKNIFEKLPLKLPLKLPFGKPGPEADDIPKVAPLPSLKEYLEKEQTGTAAIKVAPAEEPAGETSLSREEEKSIEKEIDMSIRLNELREKYDKLDALFNEKSAELEKTKTLLDNEIKNRKEFNKVKDLLEKELKDSKDKARDVQVELNNAQMESESHKKRAARLEEKITGLEKSVLEKEDKIGELVKRLQTFASPSTAATTPATEQTETPPKAESTPSEEQFPKPQPDVLSEGSPQPPKTPPPDNPESNQQDNNNDSRKE